MTDIRHALRRLRATPVVTLSAIACLAIGVWMTCIGSAVARGFFRPELGIQAPDRLVQFDEQNLFVANYPRSRGGFVAAEVSRGVRTTSKAVTDSLAARRAFAAIGYYRTTGASIDDGATWRSGVILSSGMMDVLGIKVVAGRRFTSADDSTPSLLISHRLWRTMFGGDSAVIGRRVTFRGAPTAVPIVGVMPDHFTFPRNGRRTDLYLSAGIGFLFWSGAPLREYPIRTALARLRDGTEIDDIRPVVRDVALRHVAGDREALRQWWRAENPRAKPSALLAWPVEVTVGRYYNEPVPPSTIKYMLLAIGCGLAVVLIAAANVANLLLVRGAARRQEIAVRMALGASRSRIIRELVAETGILSLAGIALGFVVAFWQWQLLDASVAGRDIFGTIDGATIPIAVAAGLILALAVGVWPGMRATSMSLEQVLRDTRRAGIGGSPLDSVLGRLVAASTAATVMLLVCAVILNVSARGWVEENVVTGREALTSRLTLDDSHTRAQRAELAREAVTRVRGLPGVRFAVVGAAPANREGETIYGAVDGGPPRRLQSVDVLDVSDGYFDAMSVRIIEGRGFTRLESRDSTTAVVLSRSAASKLFPGDRALGRQFRYWSEPDSIMHDGVVVGIAENLASGKQQLYRPFGTLAPARISVLIGHFPRTRVDAAAINKTLRAVPGLLSSDVVRLGATGGRTDQQFIRHTSIGFTLFAAVGILLAAIGTYGVVAYSVQRRTHEIGVRIALGAQRSGVTWMIVEQGLKITVTGIIFGLALSYGAARVLASFMENVKLEYALTMTGVVLLVIVISIIACLIPGVRAGGLNPVDALRAE